MPGPPPKPLATRQRRGSVSTAATLRVPEPGQIKIPPLPERPEGWTGMTRAWWKDIWSSPMSPEWDQSDLHGLWVMAAVVDDFWTANSSSARQDASAEIRLQAVRFGLSPIDRRRLQWEIERTEEAVDKGKKRQARQSAGQQGEDPKSQEGRDPREVLRLAK